MLYKSPCSKRITTAALLSTLLISALAGTMLAGVGTANFIENDFPYNPRTILRVRSPANHTTYSMNDVRVTFSLDISDWTSEFSSSASCYLDGTLVWRETILGSNDFSVLLENLSDGLYTVSVKASASGMHWHGTYSSDPRWGGWSWTLVNGPVTDTSGTIYFTVDATGPSITVDSPQTKAYNSHNVALKFHVDESASRIAYSLDGGEYVDVLGNTTLIKLSDGEHKVTVYAWDAAGNVGTSETITFSVGMQTQAQPEDQPTEPQPETFPTCAATAIIASAAVISCGLIAYFLKRKQKRSGA